LVLKVLRDLKGPQAPQDSQVSKVIWARLELLEPQDHKVQLLLKEKLVRQAQQVHQDKMGTLEPLARQDLLDLMENKAKKDPLGRQGAKVPQGRQVLKVLREKLDQKAKPVKMALAENKETPESQALLEKLVLLEALARKVHKETPGHLVLKGPKGILVPLEPQVNPDLMEKQVLLDPLDLPDIRVFQVQRVKQVSKESMVPWEVPEKEARRAQPVTWEVLGLLDQLARRDPLERQVLRAKLV